MKFKRTLVAIAAVSMSGCATVKPILVTAAGQFEACGEADASGLFAQVGQIIAANANVEAALTALGITVGVDAVKCAIAAITDALPANVAAAAPMSVTVSGAARARAWAGLK